MEVNLFVMGGMGVAVLLTWLFMRASHRWGRGRGLLRVPERVERENVERLLKARADRAQGWREIRRAIGEFGVAVVVVFLSFFFLGSVAGVWR